MFAWSKVFYAKFNEATSVDFSVVRRIQAKSQTTIIFAINWMDEGIVCGRGTHGAYTAPNPSRRAHDESVSRIFKLIAIIVWYNSGSLCIQWLFACFVASNSVLSVDSVVEILFKFEGVGWMHHHYSVGVRCSESAQKNLAFAFRNLVATCSNINFSQKIAHLRCDNRNDFETRNDT